MANESTEDLYVKEGVTGEFQSEEELVDRWDWCVGPGPDNFEGPAFEGVWNIPKSPLLGDVVDIGENAVDIILNGSWGDSKSEPTSEHVKGGVGEDWK